MPEELLFYLLLSTAVLLLFILLINNFVFYKRKLKDEISLMLILCFITAVCELLWAIFDGNKDLYFLTYIFAIGFTISVMIFASIFNRFFLHFFNCYPKKKWVIALIYYVPNVAFFILSVTTPWTNLVYSMSEDGFIIEEIFFNPIFYILIISYFIASLIVAIHYLIRVKENQASTKKIIFMLIGFDIVAPLALGLQYALVGFDSDYIALSLCLALALTFLVSNLNTLLLVESEAKMKEIETELKIASKIQYGALPPSKPNFKEKFNVALRAAMKTAKDVGGDFYDYFPLDENRICFLIADVSGKGTPAALFMMTAKTVIKDHAMLYDDTSKIFELANNRLADGNKQTMFATSWIAILDFKNMTLQYTNAGHNYPMLLHTDGEVDCLKKVDGTMLGIMKGLPYKHNTLNVKSGDRILLYTDGVIEAHNPENKLYGEDRLIELFKNCSNLSEEETIDAIYKDIDLFADGTAQFDDITMMVLTIK